MYRNPYYYQEPTFWDGLANGLLSGLEKKMEAKQNADAWNQIAGFGDTLKNLDTGGQTHLQYNVTNQLGTNVQNNAAQGLFKNIVGTQPTSNDLWQGGLLGKAGMPQAPTFNNPAPVADQTTDNTDQQGVQPQDQPQAQLATDYSFKNNFLPDNVTKTVSAPKSLTEIKSMVRSQIPLAAKELAAKGHDPSKFMPYLLQMTNDTIADYTDKYNQGQLGQLAEQFNAETNPMKRAFIAARMKQYGLEINPSLITALSPNYKLMTEDYGGTKSYSLFNTKDGNDRIQISSGPVTMNEYQRENIRTKDEGNQIKREGNEIRREGIYARGQNGGRPKANGGYSAQQVSGAKSVITAFNKWQAANPIADGTDYPYANDVYAAQNILSGAGIPYQGQYVSYDTPEENNTSGTQAEDIQVTPEELALYNQFFGS